MVRNFDIVIDQDPNGLCRMLVSGFLSYDEARQYARQLYESDGQLLTLLRQCRSLIISEPNLRLLGTTYSYRDYELFFEKQIAPIEVTTVPLLDEPGIIMQEEEEEEEAPATDNGQQQEPTDPNLPDDLFNNAPVQQQNTDVDFDDDFWR